VKERVYFGRSIGSLIRKARRIYECVICRGVIAKGTPYYNVTIGGGGLSSLKFPDRWCPACIEKQTEKEGGTHGPESSAGCYSAIETR
jgi:hypothetical protein